jgi:hypothetical protein
MSADGTGGIVITNVSVPTFSDALIQQPDGKLVTVGHVTGGSIDMLLAAIEDDMLASSEFEAYVYCLFP